MALQIRSRTDHFIVQFEDTQAPATVAVADAVLNVCENDLRRLSQYMQYQQGGLGDLFVAYPMNVQIADTSATGGPGFSGADQNGLSPEQDRRIRINPFSAPNVQITDDYAGFLLIAEVSEMIMSLYGWDAGSSQGEALSRVMAEELHPASTGNFVNTWLSFPPPRPDWISRNELADGPLVRGDLDPIAYGCGILFIYYLRYQRHFSYSHITGAGGTLLSDKYRNLTGATDDPKTRLEQILNDRFGAAPFGLTGNNPFPVTHDVLWHNATTNETQVWFTDDIESWRITGRGTVLAENGTPIFVGVPWSVVGAIETAIVWHNSATNETQIWFMNPDGRTIGLRETVVDETGSPIFVGLPWSIVGTGRVPHGSQIIWHNATTNETQIWITDDDAPHRIVSRQNVLVENRSQAALAGGAWTIKGAGDFDRDGNTDILWHNSTTNETQIWFLASDAAIVSRRTVRDETFNPIFVGPPWTIVAVSKAGIVWHNSAVNATQMWFLAPDGFTIARRPTVVDESGNPALVGAPWNIVAAGHFRRLGH